MPESENRLFQIQRLEDLGKSVCGIKKESKEQLERELEDEEVIVYQAEDKKAA